MNYTNTSRVDILTNPDRTQIEEIYSRGSEDNLFKTSDKKWDKVVQGNLKGKIKLGLSYIYFVSLIYFTIQLLV